MYKSKVKDYKGVNAKGVVSYIDNTFLEVDDKLTQLLYGAETEQMSDNYTLIRLKRIAVNLENILKDLNKE